MSGGTTQTCKKKMIFQYFNILKRINAIFHDYLNYKKTMDSNLKTINAIFLMVI
jgi:hypothetical protein